MSTNCFSRTTWKMTEPSSVSHTVRRCSVGRHKESVRLKGSHASWLQEGVPHRHSRDENGSAIGIHYGRSADGSCSRQAGEHGRCRFGSFLPVQVNFLCVHKKIRSKRLAPVLIKEITRRVNRNDGWQAVYTAGISVPTPITNATYFHRSLNPRKLIDIDFARVPSRLTITGYLRFLRLPQVDIMHHLQHRSLRFPDSVCWRRRTFRRC